MSLQLERSNSNHPTNDVDACAASWSPMATITAASWSNPGVVFAEDGRCYQGSTDGTAGNDLIRIGTQGAAVAWGHDGNDMILGHAGNDEIHGGKGDDLLDGKGGDDKYIWKYEDLGGRDKVFDFRPGDQIVLDGLLYKQAPLEQQLACLSFSIDIMSDGAVERSLQGIDFYSSRILPDNISDHQALRLLLEQGAIQFTYSQG